MFYIFFQKSNKLFWFISFDTTSSYIRGGKRTIATIGLDNVVVVDSDDSLLIFANSIIVFSQYLNLLKRGKKYEKRRNLYI